MPYEALGRVNFSARLDFSAEGGLKITEVEEVSKIEPNLLKVSSELEETFIKSELDQIFSKLQLNKTQKILLETNSLRLKENYFSKGEKDFNQEYNVIKGLGRNTRQVMLLLFQEQEDITSG